jgi:hypothetical protein
MQGKAGEQSVFVTARKKLLCYNRGPFSPASNFLVVFFILSVSSTSSNRRHPQPEKFHRRSNEH